MTDQNDSHLYQQIDEEKIIAKARESVLPEAVEAARSSLIESLQGKKKRFSWEERGVDRPANYEELFAEIQKNVPTLSQDEIDRRVEEKLKEREEKHLKELEERRVQESKTVEERRKQFDTEWYDLVNSGKMPKVSEQLQERINKGEKLTKDEIMSDEGLKARLDLMQFVQQTGKSAKLAYYEHYTSEHPGTTAPVFGSRPSGPSTHNEDDDYDSLHEEAVRRGLIR